MILDPNLLIFSVVFVISIRTNTDKNSQSRAGTDSMFDNISAVYSFSRFTKTSK